MNSIAVNAIRGGGTAGRVLSAACFVLLLCGTPNGAVAGAASESSPSGSI